MCTSYAEKKGLSKRQYMMAKSLLFPCHSSTIFQVQFILYILSGGASTKCTNPFVIHAWVRDEYKIWRMSTFPHSDKLIMQFITLGPSLTRSHAPIRVSQNVSEKHAFPLDIGPGTSDHHPGTGRDIEKICSHKS